MCIAECLCCSTWFLCVAIPKIRARLDYRLVIDPLSGNRPTRGLLPYTSSWERGGQMDGVDAARCPRNGLKNFMLLLHGNCKISRQAPGGTNSITTNDS